MEKVKVVSIFDEVPGDPQGRTYGDIALDDYLHAGSRFSRPSFQVRKFRVVDYYEGVEVLGEFDTREEARRCVLERIADTDGECDWDIEELWL